MKMHQRSITLCLIAILTLAFLSADTHAQDKKKRPARRPNLLSIPEVTRDKVICFALYTVNDNTLKLTAQLYPLLEGEDRTVRLEVYRDGKWTEVAKTKVIEDGWTAPLRVEKWDASENVPYRVRHSEKATFEGTIRRDPVDKDEIVVAGFTGNSINPAHGGDISRQDLLDNVKKIDADVLFFSGDQVYDHHRHYAAWLKFGRDFGEIIKDRPTITIPDDHDVGQPNLWGQEGKQSKLGGAADGGYARPPEYVRQVERAQTSHLPDPVDPRPINRGIGVYFTDLTWGRISFAIIEDRKFKTGPAGVVPKMGPRPDHIRNPDYDPKTVDVPGAKLLGDRQLKFLEDWGKDWKGADMKVALSQTIFCGGAHIHGRVGGRLHADMDSNGWPQTGRNKAVKALRKAFAVHFAGDQHLGSVFHHGVDEFGDANYSFCVPSIANLYLRWWDPLEPGKNRKPGDAPYKGEHLDGFHNKLICYAAANPDKMPSGGKLTTRAAGFGVLRLNKKTRKITMECWPRNVKLGDPEAKQYPDWPITIDQTDNYGRKAAAWLPTIEVSGMDNAVVQVVDDAGEVVYTLRILGKRFAPKVFKPGKYTVHVGELGTDNAKTLKGVESVDKKDAKTIKVDLQ
ncbi:MAG: hypothetical protein MI757_02265 [Pirellulales bacterium]|nr:hypothetical protein [Pirellulales bacterium]